MAEYRSFARRHKAVLNVVMLVTLASMVFVYPYDQQFRFTLGVAILSTLLLYFPQLPAWRTTALCGLAILGVRTVLAVIMQQSSLAAALLQHSPALAYYLVYGSLFTLLKVRRRLDNLPVAVLVLSLTDIASNLAELFFRSTLQITGYEKVFAGIIFVALFRALLAVYGCVVLKQYHAFVLVQDQLERYAQLIVMVAKLKTELFYLKKSSRDIEEVMERSYWLYNQMNEQGRTKPELAQYSGDALEITRNIHEVKKDYARVLTGIEAILLPSEPNSFMNLSEIFQIMEQNMASFIKAAGWEISVSFYCGDDFATERHYTIVSLLDNLLMNAVEACGPAGHIQVSARREAETCLFTVEDDGAGIPPEELPLIFKPGYSTKFSNETGKMSTGLGLSHVEILCRYLDGTVKVTSLAGQGTKFILEIPQEKLLLQGIKK